MAEFQIFDIVEEITRNDGTKYHEIGNLLHNGQAEYAVENGMLQQVRIMKINIPHSKNVINYEKYVNDNFKIYEMVAIPEWIEWNKTPFIDELIFKIMQENQLF